MIGLTQNYDGYSVHHDFFTFSKAFETFQNVCKIAEEDEKCIVLTFTGDLDDERR